MNNDWMIYEVDVGKGKPHSSRGDACPFCARETLTNILETRGDMIWLMNKYPVFRDTWPTVLVESADHNADLSTYTKEKAREVISFGMEKWMQTMANPKFQSVLYFRNFGAMAGGSQRHPHSQIIGLTRHDYTKDIKREDFGGPVIYEDADISVSLSDDPIFAMTEFNLRLSQDAGPAPMADALAILARYVLAEFPTRCESYNVFFYHIGGRILAKLYPRHSMSPLQAGYRIRSFMDPAHRRGMMERLRGASYFGG